jgi:hypothetical protein
MAINGMDPTNQSRCLAQWMRESSLSCPVTKPDLATTVAAIDLWIDDNQASFNAALPQPFRSAASAALKSELFAYVLWRRVGKLKAREDG